MGYRVEVKAIGGYTHHSEHDSYRSAIDQADMVGGLVFCETGLPDEEAYRYAVAQQGYEGDYESWRGQDDDERAEYEMGAAGLPT